MPFVQRVVQPVCLSRKPLRAADGKLLVTDYELEAVNNNTLAGALRQLASVVLIADNIFEELRGELREVCKRSEKLRIRIRDVGEAVAAFNPKTVAVPESDICAFSLRTHHFHRAPAPTPLSLFTPASRPPAVQRLYALAAATPVHVIRQMDRYRRDGTRCSRYFVCTPTLGAKLRRARHKPGIEIETRTPAALDELRRWTSQEAVGDVTVACDITTRITPVTAAAAEQSRDAGRDTADHRLPSPEEQCQAVAHHFPSLVVPINTSGRMFDRMSSSRRSLAADRSVTRRSRSRRPRGKRRNTIAACTDQRELESAVTAAAAGSASTDPSSRVPRSHSSDLLRGKQSSASPPEHHRSRLDSLRVWSRSKIRSMRGGRSRELVTPNPPLPEDINVYEAVDKVVVGTKSRVETITSVVRLREGNTRRQLREEPVHSSSGNWSASSESGRASVGSETTTTTHPPKSTTTLSSPGTSSLSLNHAAPSSVTSHRRFNTSTSSSFSEGTLTPDLGGQDDDSSVYSCDTEGYYTSFHVDSGLKTLKEEDAPITALLSTTALSRSTAENEYELFGKGSTSTTTSSAGTVCTTLLATGAADSCLSLAPAPAVPERKSSLDALGGHRAATKAGAAASHSPDSGHNTCSSPVGSLTSASDRRTSSSSRSSPQGTLEFESDFECVDRAERMREKTQMSSSRIPSMCVITPSNSDDEQQPHYLPFVDTARDYYTSLPRSFDKHRYADLGRYRDAADPQNTKDDFAKAYESKSSASPSPDDYAKVYKSKSRASPEAGNVSDCSTKVCKSTSVESPLVGSDKVDEYAKVCKPKSSPEQAEDKVDGYAKACKSKSKADKQPALQETHFDCVTDEDAGDYVTIADVRTLYANCKEGLTVTALTATTRETEYVCLDSLNNNNNGGSNKRPGARVTLDSDGKVVYSSDSLKRRTQHSSFIPGPHVRDALSSPVASPLPLHRVAKPNVRPVTRTACVYPATVTDTSPVLPRKAVVRGGSVDASSVLPIVRGGIIYPSAETSPVMPRKSQSPSKVIIRANSPGRSVSPRHKARTGTVEAVARNVATIVASRPMSPKAISSRAISPKNVVTSKRATSPKAISSRSMSPKTMISSRPLSPDSIISPVATKPVSSTVDNRPLSPSVTRPMSPNTTRPMSPTSQRPMSPTSTRPVPPTATTKGAYVHMHADGGAATEEGKVPPLPTNPHQLSSYLQRTNPALYRRISADPKVKRSDSYRMANSSLLIAAAANGEAATSPLANGEAATSPLANGVRATSPPANGVRATSPLANGMPANTFNGDAQLNRAAKDSRTTSAVVEDGRQVANPNALGRKFYGAQLKIDPSIFSAARKPKAEVRAAEVRTSEVRTAECERARVLSADQSERGQPPRYISPPSSIQRAPLVLPANQRASLVQPANHMPPYVDAYRSLPSRKTRVDLEPARSQTPTSYQSTGRDDSVHYNTAVGRPQQPSRQPFYPANQPLSQHYPSNQPSSQHYSSSQPSQQLYSSNQPYPSNHPSRQPYPSNQPSSQPFRPNQPYSNSARPSYASNQRGYPSNHADYPPGRNQYPTQQPSNQPLYHTTNNKPSYPSTKPSYPSNTPTYPSNNPSSPLINPYFPADHPLHRPRHPPPASSTPNTSRVGAGIDSAPPDFSPIRPLPPTTPRTTMTSEQIYAAIHRTRKRLNISIASPSPSPSPAPSPSSNQRRSWSPNSSEYFDFYGHFESQPNAMSQPMSGRAQAESQPNAITRRAHVDNEPARPGRQKPEAEYARRDRRPSERWETETGNGRQNGKPTERWETETGNGRRDGRPTDSQETARRHDFKVLLSRQSASRLHGLSAAEQLMRGGGGGGGGTKQHAAADKRGTKMAQWRFPSPRSDVLSTTIHEDCAAEERAERSPQHDSASSQKRLSPRELFFADAAPRLPLSQYRPPSLPSSQSRASSLSLGQSRPPSLSIGQSQAPLGQSRAPNLPLAQSRPPSLSIGQSRAPSLPLGQSQAPSLPLGQSRSPSTRPDQSRPSNLPLDQSRARLPELLSPLNTKENVNLQQMLAGRPGKAPFPLVAVPTPSPKLNVLMEKQRTPPRNVLAVRSPSLSLETAL